MKLTVDPVEFSVGSDTYRHTPLGSEAGLVLARDVMAIIGPSVGMILGTTGQLVVSLEQLAEANITPEVMADVVASFTEKVSADRLKALAKQMVERTELRTADDDGTGSPAYVPLGKRYETHFQGRIKAQLKFLAECLRVNLADFFQSA